ncbi:transcriptional regulator [Parafrankia colletiae]|uniref:Transcriptional regulator n=1 Tax=Parafrankia colletiae TaxID=573497 RepID=A0A1S1RGY5_9ACTN|nr:transcriptional regulator [Parafrankia colletiae]
MPEQIADRRELGAFLRARRERLTPAEVGLPHTGRRRTPGLRREELALLAGMSATWYTYLEQGRDVRPSEQVLTALASALRLGRAERDHLFYLAGSSPGGLPGAAGATEQLPAEVSAVPLLLQPYPAYIIGRSYDVLSHNPAVSTLFPGLIETATPNFARWVFTAPVAREVVVDWEPEAQGLLARLRTLAARHPTDAAVSALVAELREASPEVRAWWPRYDVQERHSGRKRLRNSDGRTRDYAYTAFHLADQPDQTLVIYTCVELP